MEEIDFKQECEFQFEMFWDDFIIGDLESERLQSLDANSITLRKFLSLLDYLEIPFNVVGTQISFQISLEDQSQKWSFSV
jgi:hypothetical protein